MNCVGLSSECAGQSYICLITNGKGWDEANEKIIVETGVDI